MALPKIYDYLEHQWHNNTTPSINEDELNAISYGLSKVDDRVIDITGTLMEDVPVIQHDLEILEPAIENIDANVERAETAADNAEEEALKSEGYAVGTQDGVEVTSGEYYQNNAKYYAEIANPPIENTVDFTDVITISDAINKAAKDVRLKVEAVQDLHGYTKPWPGGAGDNLLDIGESISDWFATDNNGTTIVDGDISTKVTATFTPSTGSIKVTNYNSTGYWWMSKVVKLKKNTDYKCYYSKTGGSSPALFGFSNLNVGTVGTQISPFYDTQSFNSGNYEYVVISIYPSNINVTQMQIKEASASATFTPYKNICPISGWSNAKVTRSGKNLCESKITGNIGGGGGIWEDTSYALGIAKVKKGQTYVYTSDDTSTYVYAFYTDVPAVNSTSYDGTRIVTTSGVFTAPIDGYIAFRIGPSFAYAQCEVGSAATSYEPYQGETYIIDLGDTRYGATLDVDTGVLTLDKGYADLSNLSWSSMSSGRVQTSDLASVIKLTTSADEVLPGMIAEKYQVLGNDSLIGAVGGIAVYTNGAVRCKDASGNTPSGKLVYPLATPTTVQLTAAEVYLLYGYNTLFGDCGDISLTYDASGIIHIEEAKLDTETLKTIAAASSDFADFKARIAAL